MDTLDNQLTSDQSLSSTSKQALRTASKWAKFLSIIGFIGLGFMVLAAIFLMVSLSSVANAFGGAPFVMIGVFYLFFAVLNFFPVYYLLQFSNKIRAGIDNSDSMSVEEGFVYLKSMFKFIGITTIVILSIYILLFLFAAGVRSFV